jgi:MerR family copper efflux transcriptional regulator
MYIGQVSNITGASKRAIRHYEELNLIHSPQRVGSYRVYDDHHIIVINLIKRAQSLGFKLSELVLILEAKRANYTFPLKLAFNGIDDKRKELKRQILKAKETDKALLSLKQELAEVFNPDLSLTKP